jgi:hypothetical protein
MIDPLLETYGRALLAGVPVGFEGAVQRRRLAFAHRLWRGWLGGPVGCLRVGCFQWGSLDIAAGLLRGAEVLLGRLHEFECAVGVPPLLGVVAAGGETGRWLGCLRLVVGDRTGNAAKELGRHRCL